jgi:hypothetical protein
MKEDMIADLWTAVIEYIPEKHKKETASEFVNILLDYNIKDSMLDSLQGIDPYLDQAIEYAVDDKVDSDDESYDYEEDED